MENITNYPCNAKEWPPIYINQKDIRYDLLNLANLVSELNLWEQLKNINSIENNIITRIKNKFQVSNESTFNYQIRCLENIAINGFESFKRYVYSYYF